LPHVSDYLVLGSGLAGLSFALRAAETGTVTILTKKQRADSNTNRAQGGIAAVFDANDDFEYHIRDTLVAGVGLCHPDAVALIVRDAPERIRELEAWGVTFTSGEDDTARFDLGREGGHSKKRIVHVRDHTGMAVEMALLEAVRHHPNICILENHTGVELITEHHLCHDRTGEPGGGTHCWGIYALNGETGVVDIYLAKVTLLATGGIGHAYLHTTNPRIATGDGIAMTYRAGADIANLEFMQFHPTSLYHPDGDSFLISEAVRGYGGILKTADGKPFMKKYHPQADLAPRDIVARAIDTEMKKCGDECMFLDVTHLDADDVRTHFPHIDTELHKLNIDMTREPIPVVPAAHYMCGGVLTDLDGRCTIKGLYVTGETACTGVHGANRLASNSLLEALVFSKRAFENAVEYIDRGEVPSLPDIPAWDDSGTYDHEEWVLISHDKKEIQRLMWDYVGIVRSDERLRRAKRRIRLISEEIESFYKKTRVTTALLELRNLACVSLLMIRSALFRKESRGLHYTTDYPETDDQNWLCDTVIRAGKIFSQPLDAPLNG